MIKHENQQQKSKKLKDKFQVIEVFEVMIKLEWYFYNSGDIFSLNDSSKSYQVFTNRRIEYFSNYKELLKFLLNEKLVIKL